MANRTRNIQLKICLNEEEKQIFEKKMKLAKCKTMSHFLRKCVLEKEIYRLIYSPLQIYRDFFITPQATSIRLQNELILQALFTAMTSMI